MMPRRSEPAPGLARPSPAARPDFRPPPGACDAHCHVFGPARRFPFHPSRRYTPADAPFEALQRLHRALGFERAVLVQATCHGNDNRALMDALARGGASFRGVAMIAPNIDEAELRALDHLGVRGARLSYARHIAGAPQAAEIAAVVERIAPLGWHLELYLEADDLVALAPEISALPVAVVIDHMARVDPAAGPGQAPFRTLLDLLRHPHVWVKVSCPERLSRRGPPYDDVVPFARAAIRATPRRVLWGTDWPHPNMEGRMPDDRALVDLLPELAPDPEQRHALLVGNPERLYGFDT